MTYHDLYGFILTRDKPDKLFFVISIWRGVYFSVGLPEIELLKAMAAIAA